MSGPMARAVADTPAQIPSAAPRSFGGKVAVMIDSVAGIINAAPTPWRTRAPMRSSAVPASPQRSDVSVKITRPIEKMRRRPSMSASFPPVSIRTAKLSA